MVRMSALFLFLWMLFELGLRDGIYIFFTSKSLPHGPMKPPPPPQTAKAPPTSSGTNPPRCHGCRSAPEPGHKEGPEGPGDEQRGWCSTCQNIAHPTEESPQAVPLLRP